MNYLKLKYIKYVVLILFIYILFSIFVRIVNIYTLLFLIIIIYIFYNIDKKLFKKILYKVIYKNKKDIKSFKYLNLKFFILFIIFKSSKYYYDKANIN